jgi:hypothetical protein
MRCAPEHVGCRLMRLHLSRPLYSDLFAAAGGYVQRGWACGGAVPLVKHLRVPDRRPPCNVGCAAACRAATRWLGTTGSQPSSLHLLVHHRVLSLCVACCPARIAVTAACPNCTIQSLPTDADSPQFVCAREARLATSNTSATLAAGKMVVRHVSNPNVPFLPQNKAAVVEFGFPDFLAPINTPAQAPGTSVTAQSSTRTQWRDNRYCCGCRRAVKWPVGEPVSCTPSTGSRADRGVSHAGSRKVGAINEPTRARRGQLPPLEPANPITCHLRDDHSARIESYALLPGRRAEWSSRRKQPLFTSVSREQPRERVPQPLCPPCTCISSSTALHNPWRYGGADNPWANERPPASAKDAGDEARTFSQHAV